jgi:hypothetical protein
VETKAARVGTEPRLSTSGGARSSLKPPPTTSAIFDFGAESHSYEELKPERVYQGMWRKSKFRPQSRRPNQPRVEPWPNVHFCNPKRVDFGTLDSGFKEVEGP